MTPELRSSVDWDGLCAWLAFKLRGKKLGSAIEGRIVLLVDDESGAVRHRTVINLERRQIDLLFNTSGNPELPKLLIRGRFGDLIAYLRAPSRELVERLSMFGDWRLMKTLGDLLIQKKTLLDVRAGG